MFRSSSRLFYIELFIIKNIILESENLSQGNLITYNQQGTQVCVRNNYAIKKDSIKLFKKSYIKKNTVEKITKEEVSDEVL